MKGLKYKFKYLLHESPSIRFTKREAKLLLVNKEEQELIFKDLATRSLAYRKKVMKNLEKHGEILGELIARLKAMPELKTYSPKHTSNVGGHKANSERTQYTSVSIVQGGAPGLGRRR